MIAINKYRKVLDSKGRIIIKSEEENACPICAGILKVIGIRERKSRNINEDIEILVIRRLRCKTCNKIHHELPDILIPYKRYCADTIEAVINKGEICCELSTERRIKLWWATILLYFENILASLKIKYGLEFSIKTAPREIVRVLVNLNLWVHTRSVSLSG
jgi:hypothetical protein